MNIQIDLGAGLTLRQIPKKTDEGRPLFEVLNPITYMATQGRDLIVCDHTPPGMQTDLGSVPRIVPRWIADTSESWNAAYVIHDHLCTTQKLDSTTTHKVLHTALIYLGAPKWKAWTIYTAVALFGPKFKGVNHGNLA